MIRGDEISTAVVDGPRSLVREQVANGVAVRMAVLWQLVGSGGVV
jgi:aspartate carbamoyltransferase catalytic subunit